MSTIKSRGLWGLAAAAGGCAAFLVAGSARAERASDVRTESFRKLNEGVAALRRGEYAAAVASLRASAARALNSYRAQYFLGLALTGDRRYAEAVEALRIALDLNPKEVSAHVALGDAYLRLGDVDEAVASYYRAMDLRAEHAPALDGIARSWETRADDSKAAEFFQRAIDADAGYAPAHTHLGDLRLRSGQFDQALKLLAEAVRLSPDSGAARNRLALAYSRLGLDNDAVATIRKAIELEPRAAAHRVALGRILLGMGLLGGARAALGEAAAIDATLPAARIALAEVDRLEGDYAGAVDQLDIALADPRTEGSTRGEIVAMREALEVESARLAELEPRVRSGAATPAERDDLARLEMERRHWTRAAELLADAGSDPSRRSRLAYALFRAGRYLEAHRTYAALEAEENERADLAFNSGVALARSGDAEGAAEAFRRAIEREGGPAEARAYLGNALYRIGRRDEAIEAYRSYLETGAVGETATRVRRVLARIDPRALPPEPSVPPPFFVRPPATADQDR